jgi:hypothetical protein
MRELSLDEGGLGYLSISFWDESVQYELRRIFGPKRDK